MNRLEENLFVKMMTAGCMLDNASYSRLARMLAEFRKIDEEKGGE